jgi:uncharacterized protein YecT (DUF1311 family)
MKKIIFIMAFASIYGCQTTGEETTNSCTQFDKMDAQMLAIIDAINAKNSDDDKFITAFSMEQVYWIQYRDRRLHAIYPENWDHHYRVAYGKELFNSCKCQELLRLSINRMEELKMYLDGGPEDQQNCPNKLNS